MVLKIWIKLTATETDMNGYFSFLKARLIKQNYDNLRMDVCFIK